MTLLNPTKTSLTPQSDLAKENLTISVRCFTGKILRVSLSRVWLKRILWAAAGLKHFLWLLHHPSDWKDVPSVHRDVQVGYSRFSHSQSGLLGLGCRTANTGLTVSDEKLSRNLVIRIIPHHSTWPHYTDCMKYGLSNWNKRNSSSASHDHDIIFRRN